MTTWTTAANVLSLTGGAEAIGGSTVDATIGHRSLIFVIPVFNEEENLPRLIEEFEARPQLWPDGSRVIVVDDGSRDRTAEIAVSYAGEVPIELVRLERNRGPGAAFRAGFCAALANASEDDLVVTLEGDTTSDLDAVPEMLERVVQGADVVVASWRMVNVSKRRRLMSAAAGFAVRHLLGLHAHTVSSFFRVYTVQALRDAKERYGERLIEEEGFACKAELLAKLARIGARVEEVPVRLDWGRRAGKSKMPVAATILGYWRMLLRARAAGEPAGR